MANDGIELPIEVTGNAETAIKRITDAVGKLERSGGDSLEGFGVSAKAAFEIFTRGAVVLGAIEAVKKALDLTIEAESVRATTAQFELLSKSAGISGEALKEGLVGAADGLIDDTDLIKIANQAIVELGSSASKLAPVMELARKATSVFGGDLAHNFEAIEHAISTGNTRAIRGLGIIVDSSKAYQDFAASIGTTADKLSDAGKQQAVLNAVLAVGDKNFKSVDVNLKEATDTFQRLKVTLNQIGETATLAFEKLAGQKVRDALHFAADAAAALGQKIQASFGEGVEKAKANVAELTEKVNALKVQVIDGEQAARKHKDAYEAWKSSGSLDLIRGELKQYEDKLKLAKAELDKLNASQEKATETNGKSKESLIDLAAAQRKLAEEGKAVSDRLAAEDPNKKYEKDLEALYVFLDTAEGANVDANSRLDALEDERDKKLEEKRAKELADLNAKNDSLKALDADLYASEIAANQAKIDDIIEQEGKGSKLYLLQKKKEHDAEIQIKLATATAVSGILGNMATVAKEFGEEGFAVFQALAKAQALVNTYASAVAAYNSALAIPVVGAVLAPIAAAAATAAGLANVAAINRTHLATGIDEVPAGFERDNFPAYLQTGERVVPKDTNKDLKSFLSGDGPMIALLESIDSKLSRLSTVVNIDGREVFNSMRSQLQSGRAFT